MGAKHERSETRISPRDQSYESILRENLRDNGCTCEWVKFAVRVLSEDELPDEAKWYSKASVMDIVHEEGCAMMLGTSQN